MFSKGEIVHLEADGGYHGLGVIMEPSRRSFDYRVYVFKYKKILYFHSFEIIGLKNFSKSFKQTGTPPATG